MNIETTRQRAAAAKHLARTRLPDDDGARRDYLWAVISLWSDVLNSATRSTDPNLAALAQAALDA